MLANLYGEGTPMGDEGWGRSFALIGGEHEKPSRASYGGRDESGHNRESK